ncbi:MAG: DinB family protein [Bacteroidota bacterium]|nr:DinB family protein [Bacteroidota bacterium]
MTDNPLDVRNLAFGDMDHEISATRRLLERVPEEHFNWKPHAKSWSLRELACHIVDLFGWHKATLNQDMVDTSKPWPKTQASTQKELMEAFETRLGELNESIANTSDDTLAAEWTLRHGDVVFLRMPRARAQRIYCISHLAHHRGQLTVYLRMLDVPLPPSYGPTADEQG